MFATWVTRGVKSVRIPILVQEFRSDKLHWFLSVNAIAQVDTDYIVLQVQAEMMKLGAML